MLVTPNHRFCILRTSHDHSCILQSHQDGFTYPRKEYAACTFTLYQYLDDERHRMEFANDGFAELRQANENIVRISFTAGLVLRFVVPSVYPIFGLRYYVARPGHADRSGRISVFDTWHSGRLDSLI